MRRILLLAPLLALLAGCPEQPPERNGSKPPPSLGVVKPASYMAEGKASYYQEHGELTASGERFNRNALTAAHRSLPFGTRVRVTNLENQRSVVVRINDRGPAVRGRIIDLSHEAAQRLGILPDGVVPVRLERLDN
ncbi:septal ring lytic transglycosylase RlpA family protein [Azotobacter armeniacus]